MKILIADFDLYSTVGGGQTFYKRIIETLPNIQFYYLIDKENINNKRPANVSVFKYKQTYIKNDLKGFSADISLSFIIRPFLLASNIAASITNEKFDLIDCPDYQQYGMFLRPALTYYNVQFDRIVLSLHGNVSYSLSLDWYADEDDIKALFFAEKLQYQVVDIRYGISKDYLEEWQKIANTKGYYLNPLSFLEILPNKKNNLSFDNSKDNQIFLNFIGRKEKRKGPDIFVNLISYIPRNLYSHANIFGPNSELKNGKTSDDYLQSMLNLRLSDLSLLSSLTRKDLIKLFNDKKSITFLLSRGDTLNLIALESLFSGCPTVIGNGAGVCRFLEENFPDIPFLKLDVNNIYSCLDELIYVLKNYDDYRQRLIDALQNTQFATPSFNLNDIYSSKTEMNLEARQKTASWYQQLINFSSRKQYQGKAILINAVKTILQPTVTGGKSFVNQIKTQTKTVTNKYQKQLLKSFFYRQKLNFILNLPENNSQELDYKLNELSNLNTTINPDEKSWRDKLTSGYLINRVSLWKEVSRLEEIRGNNLIATTYKLRIIRLLNQDYFGDLDNVIKSLNQEGFTKESVVAKAMYSNVADAEKNCTQLLEESYQNNLDYQPQEYEFICDRRQKCQYKVAVIISLYKAEKKLTRFLEVLAHQTLRKKQELEIILIDSGSPENEFQVFKEINQKLKLEAIYLRSQNKETIQSAWNRGILLAKSPYITFLGVDEMIVSEGLEILAQELDKNKNINWVVGHSLVTNVDYQGNWINDIMLYNRTDFDKHLAYLDTCYLTYVGGLYRKNIHERFGFYDRSFRGAGDTEFKNRILPFINCKMVDKVLGIFWNYPDERTTQSPLAEIEDLRAWYLHRTLAGVKYAFKKDNLEDAQKSFFHCLNYRKSFQDSLSTDIDYAYYLLEFLRDKKDDDFANYYYQDIKKLKKAYQNLEKLKHSFFMSDVNALNQTYFLAKKIEKRHQLLMSKKFSKKVSLQYQVFNDNRFEQHSNIW